MTLTYSQILPSFPPKRPPAEMADTHRLRPFAPSDIPAIVALCNDLQFAQSLARIPYPYTAASAHYFVHTVCSNPLEQIWAIEVHSQSSVTLIGSVSLTSPSNTTTTDYIQDLVLGIWIGRKHWRQGHASKTLNVLLPTVFTAALQQQPEY